MTNGGISPHSCATRLICDTNNCPDSAGHAYSIDYTKIIKLLISFLILPVYLFGQIQIIPSVNSARSEPSYIHEIIYTIGEQPRQDNPVTLTLDSSVPSASYLWMITSSKSTKVGDKTAWTKFTSTDRSPTFTFDSIGLRYDVTCQVTGINTVTKHSRGEIVVLPEKKVTPDLTVNLNTITASKGSPFANSATVSAVNGSSTLSTSANHGVSVGDRIRIAIGAHFYVAQSGTTGTTLVLDRNYEGPTATVPNNQTVDLGTGNHLHLIDGDLLAGTPTAIIDRLGNDTGFDANVTAGFMVELIGEFPGVLQLQHIAGTEAAPVHFVNNGEVRIYAFHNTLSFAIHGLRRNQYIIFDGHGDNAIDSHGIKLYAHPTDDGQIFFIQGALNTNMIVTGLEIPYTGADAAAAFSYDPANNGATGASHTNAAAAGNNSGNSTLVVKNVVGTIPVAGAVNIGGVSGENYEYTSYNAGTKTFTLTSTLSTNYSEDAVVNVSVSTDYNWSMDDVIFDRNYISSTTGTCDEGVYAFFNTSDTQSNGFRPAHANYAAVTRNLFLSTGRDGIQIGSCDYCEVMDNDVRNAGQKLDADHTSSLSFNDGNKFTIVARNKFTGARESAIAQTGQDGLTCYFGSNLFDLGATPVGTSPNEPIFFSMDVGLTRFVDYHWFNNTIIAERSGTALNPTKTVQHNASTTVQSLALTDANNVHIKASGNQANYPDLKVNTSPAGGRAGWLNSNLNYTVAQSANPKFTSYAGRDFTILDSTSPLYNSGTSLASRLSQLPDWTFLDIDGYSFSVNGGITSGCYSGFANFVP